MIQDTNTFISTKCVCILSHGDNDISQPELLYMMELGVVNTLLSQGWIHPSLTYSEIELSNMEDGKLCPFENVHKHILEN